MSVCAAEQKDIPGRYQHQLANVFQCSHLFRAGSVDKELAQVLVKYRERTDAVLPQRHHFVPRPIFADIGPRDLIYVQRASTFVPADKDSFIVTIPVYRGFPFVRRDAIAHIFCEQSFRPLVRRVVPVLFNITHFSQVHVVIANFFVSSKFVLLAFECLQLFTWHFGLKDGRHVYVFKRTVVC